MATTYNRLDEYMIIQSSKDKINEDQINFDDYNSWTGADLKVFTDPVNGSFHILKDMIFQIAETPLGGQTTINYYKSNTDLIFKNINSINFKINALYADYRVIKFYTVQAPDKYLGYTNFDDNFNYKRTYSVATYPWIKIATGSYRDRRGDWDLNGNTSGAHDQIQALCRSLKEAYKISGAPVWPETYKKYAPETNAWTEYEPTLTNSTSVEEVDHSDTVPRQTVWKWPQRDYLFDNKYITSCDIGPVIGTAEAPYQFSDEYLTKFAQTKPADPESRKVEKMGFTSVKSLGKILQQPVEDFNKHSIKSLKIFWTDSSKTTCTITAISDEKPATETFWSNIPKERTLGILIRLPDETWRRYGEERTATNRTLESPVQLPWGIYYSNGIDPEIVDIPRYDWTWDQVRANRWWYDKYKIQYWPKRDNADDPHVPPRYTRYIPQLKIHFVNNYYYVYTTLGALLGETTNQVSLSLYTGKFISSSHIGVPNKISFNGTRDGAPATIELTAVNNAVDSAEQWGWTIHTLSRAGRMDKWDRWGQDYFYKSEQQQEFNDVYRFYGKSDATSPLLGSLTVLNNIDLFGDVETITSSDNFGDLFQVPQNQINGWVTTCDPPGMGNGFVTLDWSYNLILKNRLLPYMDQRFLPITDWNKRNFWTAQDELAGSVTVFASNCDGDPQHIPFGYTVGVRIYNASNDNIRAAVWDKGPLKNSTSIPGPLIAPSTQGHVEGKEFTITYDKTKWSLVNDMSSDLGKYRKRNSMAYQFRNYYSTTLDNYFTDESHFIAPPVGLVLE